MSEQKQIDTPATCDECRTIFDADLDIVVDYPGDGVLCPDCAEKRLIKSLTAVDVEIDEFDCLDDFNDYHEKHKDFIGHCPKCRVTFRTEFADGNWDVSEKYPVDTVAFLGDGKVVIRPMSE